MKQQLYHVNYWRVIYNFFPIIKDILIIIIITLLIYIKTNNIIIIIININKNNNNYILFNTNFNLR